MKKKNLVVSAVMAAVMISMAVSTSVGAAVPLTNAESKTAAAEEVEDEEEAVNPREAVGEEENAEAAGAEGEAEAEAPALEYSPDWIAELPQAEEAEQLFVVAGVGDTTAYISMHEKDEDGNWKQIMTTPGFIGKAGMGKTKEGDARTPVGTFTFNYAFGIAKDPGCALEYHQVDENAYWSGDQREGYHYNEMVDITDLPDLNTEDSEHIVDYTHEYQYCLNVSYNEEGTPGLGSAIFLHCFGALKPYTGGCIAIPEEQMLMVMKNVREDCVVVIDSLYVLSPETWKQLNLPVPEEAAEKTEESPEIAAVYCAAGEQILTNADGSKTLADTVVYIYKDGTYKQYVMHEGIAELFSTGKCELNGELDPEKSVIVTMTVEKVRKEGRGLVGTDVSYDVNLTAKDSYRLYPLDESDKEITAAFLQADKQKLVKKDGSEEYLPTMWFYYDDGTFEQYALLGGEERVLFSSGDYSIDGDFGEKGSILQIHRTKKYKDGSGLAPYESLHDYEIGKLDFIRIYPQQIIGHEVAIPEEYAEELIVKTGKEAGGKDAIISVYEKASVEAAKEMGEAENDGAGWLFSIGKVSAGELQEMLCRDMSGMDVFAKDVEGRYYIYYHPTDVRLVRNDGAYFDEVLKKWTELNEWAASVPEEFVAKNDGLVEVHYDNSEESMALSRAAYEEDLKYTLSTTEFGPLEPGEVDAAPYVEKLIRNVKYSYADPEETPDGEYVVLNFPDEDLRFDFFLAEGKGNYIRRTTSEGTGEGTGEGDENEGIAGELVLAEFEDGETVASKVMQEWYDALAKAAGKK